MSVTIVTDFILIVLMSEALILTGLRMKQHRARELLGDMPNLVAGAFLVAALRGALTGISTASLLLFLAAAGIAHAIDFYRRLEV